uniref:mediator of RNA polymerase II transcription subunit 25-like isoform X1 n=1 Tax=Fragaria vesca subsp. vesca TaxID=101020 RepID=UPI0005C84F9D|nr:PREDICTED: mediator of RNA polymerase II transcription subunit 25-like isoform X1 [Fragaria vesca subsp. vesca]
MAAKQLIVVVEGTMAMEPYWPTVFCDYVEKIIRSFPGNELCGCGPKPSTCTVEMSLVTFNTHGSGCLVQRSGWTRDIELFLRWLSAIPFNGGGFSHAAIAEGLSEALMMFSTIQNGSQNQQNVDFQKHCILVAASDPCPLPTPVYRPQMQNVEQSEISDVQTESCLYDAEAVAKSFAQCFVSLSVICPKQLPKLRAIYNAGKRNPRAADPPIDNVKNPPFLVLISENFIEARATLTRPALPKAPVASVTQPHECLPGCSSTDPPPTSRPSGNSNPGMSQPMSNLQGGASIGQSVPGINQNHSGSQMVQNKLVSACPSGTGTMIPPLGISQQAQSGIQSVGANYSSVFNPLSQQTSSALQSARSSYVKVWEGNLSLPGRRQGQPVVITRLEGYRRVSARETLAAKWPPTLQIVKFAPLEPLINKQQQYSQLADILVFRVMDGQEFVLQMQEKKLCAVIKLPSQTLVLYLSQKDCYLIGMLFPWAMVVLKPQVVGQQQMQQQQPHLTTEASASTDTATAAEATAATSATWSSNTATTTGV